METSQLICRANQLTGLYIMGTLVFKGLTFYRMAALFLSLSVCVCVCVFFFLCVEILVFLGD